MTNQIKIAEAGIGRFTVLFNDKPTQVGILLSHLINENLKIVIYGVTCQGASRPDWYNTMAQAERVAVSLVSTNKKLRVAKKTPAVR